MNKRTNIFIIIQRKKINNSRPKINNSQAEKGQTKGQKERGKQYFMLPSYIIFA